MSEEEPAERDGQNEQTSDKVSRRVFLGTVAAGAMLAQGCGRFPSIVPRDVLGGPGHAPPSERINFGCVGCGGRGRTDIKGFASQNIIALCDVDEERAAKAFKEYPDVPKYKDYREMLAMHPEIDAVMIATPDHTHANIALAAMEAGKHVFVEKPLARSIHEVRLLLKASRKHKVVTQMGIQGHAGEGARLTCEWIWAGAIGPVRELHYYTDRPIWPQGMDWPTEIMPIPRTLDWYNWLGPAPDRPYHASYLPFDWRGWWDYGAGALGDIACHAFDVAFWALDLGMPTRVSAETSPVNAASAPEWSIATMEFPARGDMPPVTLRWHDGGKMIQRPAELEPGRALPDDMGQVIIGEAGKIMADVYCKSPRVIPEQKMRKVLKSKPPKVLPRSPGHYEEFIRAVKGGAPPGANFEFACPMTEAVLLGNLAIRTGKEIRWDAEAMQAEGVPEADQYIKPEFRAGWGL